MVIRFVVAAHGHKSKMRTALLLFHHAALACPPRGLASVTGSTDRLSPATAMPCDSRPQTLSEYTGSAYPPRLGSHLDRHTSPGQITPGCGLSWLSVEQGDWTPSLD